MSFSSHAESTEPSKQLLSCLVQKAELLTSDLSPVQWLLKELQDAMNTRRPIPLWDFTKKQQYTATISSLQPLEASSSKRSIVFRVRDLSRWEQGKWKMLSPNVEVRVRLMSHEGAARPSSEEKLINSWFDADNGFQVIFEDDPLKKTNLKTPLGSLKKSPGSPIRLTNESSYSPNNPWLNKICPHESVRAAQSSALYKELLATKVSTPLRFSVTVYTSLGIAIQNWHEGTYEGLLYAEDGMPLVQLKTKEGTLYIDDLADVNLEWPQK